MRIRTLAAVLGIAALPLPAGADPLVDRGAYLVNGIMACGNCHTPKGPDGDLPGMELAGGMAFEFESFTAYASNLTMDRETGLGTWTDAQIIHAIRNGQRPDGSLIGPPMPVSFYREMSDEDARAVVAYLRSLPTVHNAVPPSEYRMPLPPDYGPAVTSVPAPDRNDPVAYGGYLAAIGHCMECHTPMEGGSDLKDRLGVGGVAIPGPWGIAVSANITSHPEDGVGAWTDEALKAAITKGVRPDGEPLGPPMPYHAYARMADADLNALIAWLRALPPLPDPK